MGFVAHFMIVLVFFAEGCSSLNLAYQGHAWQSSTVYGGIADKVLDGNTDSNFMNDVCSHTASGANPWLIIDLGQVETIEAVAIFNRGDNCGERLQNFTIEVALSQPSNSPFTGFTLCNYNPQPAITGEKVMMKCPGPLLGRFVKLQTYHSWFSQVVCGGYEVSLAVCEIEVFSAGLSGNKKVFKKVQGVRATGSVLSIASALSRVHCTVVCSQSDKCTSCNVRKDKNSFLCELLDELDPLNKDNSGTPIAAPGWSHYY